MSYKNRTKKQSVLINSLDYCAVCGAKDPEIHHVFYGTANRKISEKFRYVYPLCYEHHRGKSGVHFDHKMDLELKQAAQRHFEQYVGNRALFRELFGKSWL